MRCNSTTKIVGRTDIDVAIDEFEKINVPHAATLSLRSFGASGDTLRPVVSGWPATRNPQGEGWRRGRDSPGNNHYPAKFPEKARLRQVLGTRGLQFGLL
jgi:hypothetical protein